VSRYELFIQCKACRTSNHSECSGKRFRSDDCDYNMVAINCTCSYCKDVGTTKVADDTGPSACVRASEG
jgi:hypothetical protein